MEYKFPVGFWWGAAASGPQTDGIENKVNKSININTNAVILESLLYEKLGRKPFLTIKQYLK